MPDNPFQKAALNGKVLFQGGHFQQRPLSAGSAIAWICLADLTSHNDVLV
jgi:hypothetical protein